MSQRLPFKMPASGITLVFVLLFFYFFSVFDIYFQGPDEPIYLAYTASIVNDGDLNVANQLRETVWDLPVSKTYNFPDFHDHGSLLLHAPFYIYAKFFYPVAALLHLKPVITHSLDTVTKTAVSFSTVILGFLAIFFVYQLCADFFSVRVSLLATLSIFFGTPFFYYVLFAGGNSHIPAGFLASVFIWFLARAPRLALGKWHWFLCGLFFSASLTVRTDLWLLLVFAYPFLILLCSFKKVDWQAVIFFSLGLVPVLVLKLVNSYIKFGFLHPEEMFYITSFLRYRGTYTFNGLFNSFRGIFYTSPILFLSVLGMVTLLIETVRRWRSLSKEGKIKHVFFVSLCVYAVLKLHLISKIFSPGGDTLSGRYFFTEFPVFALLFAYLLDGRNKFFRYGLWFACSCFVFWNALIISEFMTGLDWFYLSGAPNLLARLRSLPYLFDFLLFVKAPALKITLFIPALLLVWGGALLLFRSTQPFLTSVRSQLRGTKARGLTLTVFSFLTLYLVSAYTFVTALNASNNGHNARVLKDAGFFQYARVIGPTKHNMTEIEENEHMVSLFTLGAYYILKGDLKEREEIKRLREEIFQNARLVSVDHIPFRPYLKLASYYAVRERDEQVIACYEQLLRHDPQDFEANFNLGELYSFAGKYKEAIAAYKQALSANPEMIEIYNIIGNLYNRLYMTEEAAEYLRKLIELNPSFPDAYVTLATLYRDRADYPQAIGYLEEALRLRPGYFDAYLNLGEIYASIGDYGKAEALFRQAIKMRPNRAETYLSLADVYSNQGLYPKAVNSLQLLIELRPDFADAYPVLGYIYFNQGKYTEAIQCFRKTIKLQPGYPGVNMTLGEIYTSQGDYDKAIEYFQQALKRKPNYPDVYLSLGNIHFSQGNSHKAIEIYQQALKLRPQHPDTYILLGNVYAFQGDLDKAIEYFQKAISIRPDYADTYLTIGALYANQGNTDKAIESFLQARDLRPSYPGPNMSLGEIYAGQGDYDKAIEYFQQALKLRPHYPDAYLGLGNTYAARGDYDEAIGAFQQALKLRPQHPDAYIALGGIYSSQGNTDKAIESLLLALKFSPRHPDALMILGEIYAGQGDYDKAISSFEKIAQIKPAYAQVYSMLGGIYRQKGDKQNVLRQIKKLEQLHREDLAAELKNFIEQ